MTKGIIAAACLALLSTGLVSAADGPHDKAIKARKALMQIYAYNSGLLGDMAKGKRDYDAELASALAANLKAATHMDQSTMWPPGSDNANPENAKNRALPAIWETYPKIAESGMAMTDATAALEMVAGNGLDALKGAMGDVGNGCKGCHDDFRAKRK